MPTRRIRPDPETSPDRAWELRPDSLGTLHEASGKHCIDTHFDHSPLGGQNHTHQTLAHISYADCMTALEGPVGSKHPARSPANFPTRLKIDAAVSMTWSMSWVS